MIAAYIMDQSSMQSLDQFSLQINTSSIFKVLSFMISSRYLLIFSKLAFKYGVGNCNY